MKNKIIIDKLGQCTVIGSLAHQFYYRNISVLETLTDLNGSNIAWVYEVNGTLRAGQSTIEGAKNYLNDERVIVIREV